MQSIEPLLGRGLCPPDAAQHHLDQFIAAAHARLAQEGQQQRVPLPACAMSEQVTHLQRRGLGGELAQLGMGDAFQQRVGIDQPRNHSIRSIQSLIVLGVAGPGVCFRRLKAVVGLLAGLTSRASSTAAVFVVTAFRHPIVDPSMNFRAQPIYQAVKSAECRQIDGRGLQRLDRPVDEVGRVTHGFGRFKHSPRDQKPGRVSIGRDAKDKSEPLLDSDKRLCPTQFIER